MIQAPHLAQTFWRAYFLERKYAGILDFKMAATFLKMATILSCQLATLTQKLTVVSDSGDYGVQKYVFKYEKPKIQL